MAAKRQATSDLNHDNWDRDEEPEESGRFQEANEEELKRRVIKKARRRVHDEGSGSTPLNNGDTSNSIFSGFKGFAKTTNSSNCASKPSPFAFLAKIPPPGASVATDTKIPPTNIFSSTFSFESGNSRLMKTEKTTPHTEIKDENVYLSKIMKLNQSFSAWIQKHVVEQPLCNLMPTFKDYEKYMKEINKEQEQPIKSSLTTNIKLSTENISKNVDSSNETCLLPVSTSALPTVKLFSATSSQSAGFGTTNSITISNSVNVFKGKNESNTKPNSEFSFGNKSVEKPNGNPITSTGSTFGQSKSNGNVTAAEKSKPTFFAFGSPINSKPITEVAAPFSFGSKLSEADSKSATPSSSSFGFTFASSMPSFTFANIKPPIEAPTKESEDGANDVEEDEPPKEEIKEVIEGDALFTKKCKVFVKKDGTYKDYGIGTFFLKPVKDSSKTQLLVRSCNNLGTILINVILTEGMPTQRIGKNNVMLVHPGATGESKPQTTLFRVKDGEEADILLETINNHKK